MFKNLFSLSLALVLFIGALCVPGSAGYNESYGDTYMMPMLFHDGYANNSEGMFDYNGKMIKDAKAVEALGCEFSYFSEGLIRYRVLVSTYDYSYKYGYRDKNFNIVIEAVYDDARPFSEGLAAVYDKERRLWGYIDKTGNVVLPFKYSSAASFIEGLALITEKTEAWGDAIGGFINKRGDMIIPNILAYPSNLHFSDGLCFAYKIDDPKRPYLGDSTFGVLDINGNFAALSFKLSTINIKKFSEGLAAATGEDSNKWGYIDKTGKWAIEPQYEVANTFSEGLAAVSFDGDKFGFIDKSGKMVIPDTDLRGYHTSVISFNEGLCAIYNRSYNLGYIDKTGKTVIPFRYNSAMPFKEGHAWVYVGHNMSVLKNPLGYTPPAQPQQPPSLIASPTSSTVLVNGKTVAFDAYNIGGNNYFKLRDLAYTLNGSNKQFEVAFESETNSILLTSNKAYSVIGGEMQGKGAGDKTPIASTQKIVLDGKEVKFTAYNIDGNNYFMLRDIGAAFDFGVDWDGALNTIRIDTSKGYTTG